jgi:polar amino acid transport system substrate-binding protein
MPTPFHRRSVLALAAAALAPVAWAQSADSTLAQIKQRGTLRVGVTQAPPWYSKDPKSGDWTTGVGVSVGKAMATSLGVKFEPVEVTWGTAIAALQGNKIDMMSMMDATPERAQAVDFPKTPLLFYSLAVLARDDLAVKAWADLDQPSVRIAVPQASSMDKFLTENVAKAQISRFPGNAEAIAAFQAGRADAVCLFHPPLLAARQKLGAGKIVVPTPAQSQAPDQELQQAQPNHAASPKVDQQPVVEEPVLVAAPEPQPAAPPSAAEPVSAAAPAAEPASAGPPSAEPALVSLQTIANAYRDYTRKSIEEFGSFVEQLSGARSLDKAMTVQSEFVKRAYETSVAESQKICELHNRLAKQSLDPFKALTGKTPAPHGKR